MTEQSRHRTGYALAAVVLLLAGVLGGMAYPQKTPPAPQIGRYQRLSDKTVLDTKTGKVWYLNVTHNDLGVATDCKWVESVGPIPDYYAEQRD